MVEQPGVVKVVRGERKVKESFLSIKNRVSCCGERGLLSIAFPNFRRDRRFYVYFTDNDGDIRVVEYKRKRGKLKANEGSAATCSPSPTVSSTTTTGASFSSGRTGCSTSAPARRGADDPDGNAQDRDSLLGKLLRINPLRRGGHCAVRDPGVEPVRRRGAGTRSSPAGCATRGGSRSTAPDLIADVGQDRVEEINYETLGRARGANFGWDAFEGNSLVDPPAPGDHPRPIHTYSHGGGGCSITGGYVVRDHGLGKLRGRYLYGDFCKGQIRSLKPKLGGARRDRSLGLPRIDGLSSFGIDDRRNVYVASLGGGVWRLVRG